MFFGGELDPWSFESGTSAYVKCNVFISHVLWNADVPLVFSGVDDVGFAVTLFFVTRERRVFEFFRTFLNFLGTVGLFFATSDGVGCFG